MTLNEIVERASIQLGDSGFSRWEQAQFVTSINNGYRRLATRVGAIQRSTQLPFTDDTPYYNFRQIVSDYHAVKGIYNFKTNHWIQFVSEKTLNNIRWDWERWVGEPVNCGIILDWNRVGIFPYSTTASGTFLLWYTAWPADLLPDNSPELPESFHHTLVDYCCMDLLRSEREFFKARQFTKNFYAAVPGLEREVNLVASYDKDFVLEPYLGMPRYGSGTTGI